MVVIHPRHIYILIHVPNLVTIGRHLRSFLTCATCQNAYIPVTQGAHGQGKTGKQGKWLKKIPAGKSQGI